MRRLPFFLQNLLIVVLCTVLPALAIYQGTTTFSGLAVTNNATVGGNLTVTGTTTQTGAVTFTAKPTLSTGTIGANGDTYTIPDVGNASFVMTAGAQTKAGVLTLSSAPVLSTGTITANGDTNTIPDLGDASFVMTAGNQTIAGTKTFSSPPTITGGLTAANIQTGSAKREILRYQFAGDVATHTAADSTVYSALIFPGRACTVKRISFGAVTPPVGGTDTLKVLKGSSSGNTMLNAATYDATTLTANQASAGTLTATGADLQVAASGANSGIYVEYSAGSQTTDAVDLSVTIEIEPDDF